MSANTIAKPPASGEPRAARKKKVRGDAATTVSNPSPSLSNPDRRAETPTIEKLNGVLDSEGGDELPAVKEIHKNIRNTAKKLSVMSRLDSIIAENPDLSLDDLVTTRKINADQKAQALKKPALQAQLALYEEQLSILKGVEEYYTRKLEAQKAKHDAELSKVQESHLAETNSEQDRSQITPSQGQHVSEALNSFKPRFLTLTRFLRAAAARRQRESEDQGEPALAFEGILLALYGGDSNAVFAAEKLINGSDDFVSSPDGTMLSLTYTQVRDLALQETPFLGAALYEPSHPEYEIYQQAEREGNAKFGGLVGIEQLAQGSSASGPGTDPTVAHAGLTEIDVVQDAQQSLPSEDTVEQSSAPATGSVADSAANAAAADRWDTKAPGVEDPMEGSYEIIPRPDSEVDIPAQTAPFNSTTSWADDTPDQLPIINTNTNGGFQEVTPRNQRGRGGYQWQNVPQAPAHLRRGGGGGGHQHGHSSRGSFSGRGRGEGRGRGGPRGGRGRGAPGAGAPGAGAPPPTR